VSNRRGFKQNVPASAFCGGPPGVGTARAKAAKERTKKVLEKIMVLAVARRWLGSAERVGEYDAGDKQR